MAGRIEQGFFTYLTTYVGLSSLIGTRLYPVVLAQNTEYPCVRYFRVSDPVEISHNGPVALGHPRYQFECLSPDHDTAWQVAQALEFAVNGFRGSMGTVTNVASMAMDTREDYNDVLDVYRVMVDVVFWHKKEVS